MMPALFVRVDALPLSPNGKVDRYALPPPNQANTLRDDPFLAPRTPVEARVAGIVAALLGLEHVGVDDNFFLLGGHSLLGTQLITRLRDAFDVELTLRSLFEAPTVAKLATEIECVLVAKIAALGEEEVERLLSMPEPGQSKRTATR
jgi:acyl carrier protein